MSHLTFSPDAELASFKGLIDRAGQFLQMGSASAFDARRGVLSAQLRRTDLNAVTVNLNEPIRTVFSKEYKGHGDDANAHDVRADVTFSWSLERIVDQPSRFNVKGGGVNVTYLNQQGAELRKFHYDVCQGGPDAGGGTAQHPFAHFQFHGAPFADLPRLPTLIFTPTDVLEQVLLDLWPRRWPSVASSMASRAALTPHYAGQRTRIEACATRYIEIAKTAKLPLRGLQDRLTQDLAI